MQRVVVALAFVGVLTTIVFQSIRNRRNLSRRSTQTGQKTQRVIEQANVSSETKNDKERVEHLSTYVAALARIWHSRDPDRETRDEVHRWIKEKNLVYAKHRLQGRLHFGTAGLRGAMGAGYDRMNMLTVLQTTQGVLKYLEQLYGRKEVKRRGVCVGRDGRHCSDKFAAITQTVFLLHGIPIKSLSSTTVPTPLVSFAVTHCDCVAGIMITASHNPKNDNGYKLYLADENLEPWSTEYANWIQEDQIVNHPLYMNVLEHVTEQYMNTINNLLHLRTKESNESSIVAIYSPLHGVGAPFFKRLCDLFHLRNMVFVTKQLETDPEFPTVPFPNPEEGPLVFEEAFTVANSIGGKFILMNDPDADRFAAAEYIKGSWKIFSGNEIAFLLFSWLWKNRKKLHERWKRWRSAQEILLESFDGTETEEEIPNNRFACVISAVSSRFLQTMSEIEGFVVHETLTGFKWLSHAALALEESKCQVLLAYEEALGYMCTTKVRDKDGISTAAIFWELASDWYEKGLTLTDCLSQLYERYGYHLSYNGYLLAKNANSIPNIFENIRKNGYPTEIQGCLIQSIRDLNTGMDTAEKNGLAKLPSSPCTYFITFRIQSGLHPSFKVVDIFLSIRASGTEPKLKYYSEMRCDNGLELKGDEQFLKKLVHTFIEEVLKPKENQLEFPQL
eukprot:jgi/Galph1/3346/GphlegSOOS_G2043.1